MKRGAGKWALTIRVLPLAGAAVSAKAAVHAAGLEVLTLHPLLSGMLAATVFLLGFLISGVLTDYKESERLPGELVAALEALVDEAWIGRGSGDEAAPEACHASVRDLVRALRSWFDGRTGTDVILAKVAGLNVHMRSLTACVAPPFLFRMKQEQSALRRTILRIDAIRRTSFIGSGYAIAEVVSTLLIAALVLTGALPFGESLFIVAVVAFLLTYMLTLIRALDDPFQGAGGAGDAVSLRPLEELERRLGRG